MYISARLNCDITHTNDFESYEAPKCLFLATCGQVCQLQILCKVHSFYISVQLCHPPPSNDFMYPVLAGA